MGSKPEVYDNKVLIENLQRAYRDWKCIESMSIEQGNVYVRHNNICGNAESLKDAYLALLRKARERGLSLTREELLSFILYTETPMKR
ncbi:MAG: hypothetical protein GX340_02425 [Clostridiales bacterium]|jgi:hypothetical protein|nr:hypothetical protein [Clostridiales bacterium]